MPTVFSLGKPFIELQQVESTNNYATALVHEGMAQHGAVVFAHHQLKGKGQRHKQWHSEAGKNITVSILLQPGRLNLSQAFLLSMAMALGTYRFFFSLAGDETKIKWPNDIYWRDRKAAGILIENIIQGTEWKWSIVGIGINVNQTLFEELHTKATSLKQITGKEFDPLQLAKELCRYLSIAYTELQQSEQGILTSYKAVLFKLNESVLLKKGTRTFAATIKDVTKDGRLVVETSMEESFEVGEIEWVI